MRKRYVIALAMALAVLVGLIFWQVSLDFGSYANGKSVETIVFWAISTFIFLLAVMLGFILFRTGVKLFLERQENREGSRLQTKLVLGALALSLLPVIFLVAFSFQILNRSLRRWFMNPVENIKIELLSAGSAYGHEVQGRADALARWLALSPEVRNGTADFVALCQENRIREMRLEIEPGKERQLCGTPGSNTAYSAESKLGNAGNLIVRVEPPADIEAKQSLIDRFLLQYNELSESENSVRNQYHLFILLIGLFILYVSTWIALKLARQISGPISALLEAAGQVRQGNLSYRVVTPATDELATLVRGFNEMTQELESNSRELESRRRFTEAILESIPTGVISLTSEGRIQRVNRASRSLFTEEELGQATSLSDLLPREHSSEIAYLMKRARRTGLATTQMDVEHSGQVLHLSVTVSALPLAEPGAPGYVVVLEDTSDLLRAQKSAAWHEVARRIAHELKNPLTPIALSAERIARQLDRGALTPEAERVLRQCAAIISREVESVKTLADEFSQFARFPAAQPVSGDLNEVVRKGLDVFAGRLEGIDVRIDLAAGLPLVQVDAEQMKRVVVNLIDNAAEAMRDSPVKRLWVATRVTAADTVELLVEDTGVGVSPGDKERLFLPYFSTKERGTGLGLAIVSHILSEHGARIRIEDNRPAGTRFFVEIPVQDTVPVGSEVDNSIILATSVRGGPRP